MRSHTGPLTTTFGPARTIVALVAEEMNFWPSIRTRRGSAAVALVARGNAANKSRLTGMRVCVEETGRSCRARSRKPQALRLRGFVSRMSRFFLATLFVLA
eukprot:2940891-Prymnesium_polylepis.1